jgi:hypothetical protein
MEILKELGAFPIVQLAVALIIILGGYMAIIRGSRDGSNGKKTQNGGGLSSQAVQVLPLIPDLVRLLRDTEQSGRRREHHLERIEEHLKEMARDSSRVLGVLELMRNEMLIPRRKD